MIGCARFTTLVPDPDMKRKGAMFIFSRMWHSFVVIVVIMTSQMVDINIS